MITSISNPRRTAIVAFAAILLATGSFGSANPPSGQEPAAETSETPPAKSAGAPESVPRAPLPVVLGARVFIDPETGELTSEPAPGQVERLLAIGRAQAAARSVTATASTSTAVGQPSQAEITNHSSAIFTTSVGVGAALDDRFLHALKVKVTDNGKMIYVCDQHGDHDPPSRQPQP